MINWLRKLFARRPKIWAVGVLITPTAFKMVKAVTYGRPIPDFQATSIPVVGPFRSDIDCEEFIAAVHTPQIDHIPEDGEQSHA